MSEGQQIELSNINEIPISLNGAARYNVANALAASAICWHLLGLNAGLTTDEIARLIGDGLKTFDGNRDNPGRGNLREINGISIMVDFAHNPHGLNAVVDTLLQIPAKRRLVMLGHAGDRSNEDIGELTQVAQRLNPERVVIFELEDYLRGRQLGEIPDIIIETLTSSGYPAAHILLATDPVDGTSQALEWAQEGDFLLLLALGDRGKVFETLDAYAREFSTDYDRLRT
jgi:UDP-N-acetylmuramyl tripeptide synthase